MCETNHHRITKKDRERAVPGWYMIYEVYTVRYKFENIYLDGNGIPYGYCKKNRRLGWLYPDGISHFGRDIDFIPAKLIENNGVVAEE